MRHFRLGPLLLALGLLVGCGGDSTGPATSFVIVFLPFSGSYTATLNNQSYTATGVFEVSLPTGVHEVTGSFTGDLAVGFGTLDSGGVESSSLRSLAGPNPQVSSCSVMYMGSGSGPQPFRLEFSVTRNVGSACQRAS